MKQEHVCQILNHPSDEVELHLTLRLENTEVATHMPPFAVAVSEGMAYVIPLIDKGETHPLVVLCERSEFPPESTESVTLWWREALHKRPLADLKDLLKERGIEGTKQCIISDTVLRPNRTLN